MNTSRSSSVISGENLTKTYGQTHALRGVSIDVMPGEAVAIMGPSGSGKTTLLHALAGMIRTDAGTVKLGAVHMAGMQLTSATNITALSEAGRTQLRREVFGFVFQQGLLLPELTAIENVAMAAMLKGANRQQATAMAADWLQRLGLAEHGNKLIGQLSGGQAQRVAIARAQVTDPVLVFADEPTGALDSSTGAEVLRTLLATTTGRGRTLIMVTHDEQVAASCSRVVRLQDGQVIADSANPTNRANPRSQPAQPQPAQPQLAQPQLAQPQPAPAYPSVPTFPRS